MPQVFHEISLDLFTLAMGHSFLWGGGEGGGGVGDWVNKGGI